MSESQLGPVQFVGSVNLLGVITDMNLNTCDWKQSQINCNVGI